MRCVMPFLCHLRGDSIVTESIVDGVSVVFTFNGYDTTNFTAIFHDDREGAPILMGRNAQRAWMKIQQPGTVIRWVADDTYGRIHPYRVRLEISRARLVRLGFL
jgi:hypothetical protein